MSKRKRSWKVCPNCKGRATKIVTITDVDKPILCQQCDHRYSIADIRAGDTA